MPVLKRNGRRLAEPTPMRFVARRASDATSDVRGVDRVVGIPERARVDVRRPAGQRGERGRAVQQAVGRLVERAVAGEHRDDVEAVVRGGAREAGGVTAP